jgi:hypothetical protein
MESHAKRAGDLFQRKKSHLETIRGGPKVAFERSHVERWKVENRPASNFSTTEPATTGQPASTQRFSSSGAGWQCAIQGSELNCSKKNKKEQFDFELRNFGFRIEGRGAEVKGSVFKVPGIIIIEGRLFKSSDFGKLMQKIVLFM